MLCMQASSFTDARVPRLCPTQPFTALTERQSEAGTRGLPKQAMHAKQSDAANLLLLSIIDQRPDLIRFTKKPVPRRLCWHLARFGAAATLDSRAVPDQKAVRCIATVGNVSIFPFIQAAKAKPREDSRVVLVSGAALVRGDHRIRLQSTAALNGRLVGVAAHGVGVCAGQEVKKKNRARAVYGVCWFLSSSFYTNGRTDGCSCLSRRLLSPPFPIGPL